MRGAERVPGADRVIAALDTQDTARAVALVESLSGAVGGFKLGIEFLHAAGPEGVRAVQKAGATRLFLDGKFSDIPNTVAGAVRSACSLHPWLLTVHAMCGPVAMRSALDAAIAHEHFSGTPRPYIIAVTLLTSLDQQQLDQIGIRGDPLEAVVRLARLAQDCGLDGVVASPLEIEALRKACGPGFLIVTPGIRPAGRSAHDQARVATPAAAVRAGADYLVIGRAIAAAPDPRAAAEAVAAEIAAAESAG